MLLYRVCPIDSTARPASPYHPAFVPRSTGQHRIDNAERYDTLYVSGAAAGAVAERFGVFAEWGDWLLEHPRGFEVQLVTFDLSADRAVLDLDNATALAERSLRPSRVVTRNRQVTQTWAAEVHAEEQWAGISWWSYYDPDWVAGGLWCPPGDGAIPRLSVVDVEPLDRGHRAIVEAGRSLLRSWASSSR